MAASVAPARKRTMPLISQADAQPGFTASGAFERLTAAP